MAFDNFFQAQELIIQRLQEQVPGLGHVGGARSLKEVFARNVAFPAALVLFNKHKPIKGQQAAFGAFQGVEQLIEVVIVDDNQEDFTTGAGAREEAGPLILQTINALIGWIPSEAHTNLKLETAPPAAYVGGLAYFPLAFSTEVHLNAGATL
jgi:hypothetical protein